MKSGVAFMSELKNKKHTLVPRMVICFVEVVMENHFSRKRGNLEIEALRDEKYLNSYC